jgi:hypothetical protein
MTDLAQAAREAAAVRKAKLRELDSLAAVLTRAFREGGRGMIAWAGRRLGPAARTVIRAVRMANNEQVRMWECVLLTSGAVPLSAAGPLRWVPSPGGNRLIGSHLPAQDPSGRACSEGICDQEET